MSRLLLMISRRFDCVEALGFRGSSSGLFDYVTRWRKSAAKGCCGKESLRTLPEEIADGDLNLTNAGAVGQEASSLLNFRMKINQCIICYSLAFATFNGSALNVAISDRAMCVKNAKLYNRTVFKNL